MKKFKDIFKINSAKESISNAFIDSLDIDKESRSIIINLISNNTVSQDDISFCEALLLDCNLKLSNVKINVSENQQKSTENNEKAISQALKEVSEKSRSISKILNNASFNIFENNVEINLFHGGKDLLTQKNTDKELSVLISQKLNKSIQVILKETPVKEVSKPQSDYVDNITISEPAVDKEEEKEDDFQIPEIEIRTKETLYPQPVISSAKLLYGNSIKKEPISIREIDPQMPNAVVWGKIFFTDSHETRDGSKIIFSVYITDYTGSLILKIIENKKQSSYLEKLKKGTAILVYGELSEDKYEKRNRNAS